MYTHLYTSLFCLQPPHQQKRLAATRKTCRACIHICIRVSSACSHHIWCILHILHVYYIHTTYNTYILLTDESLLPLQPPHQMYNTYIHAHVHVHIYTYTNMHIHAHIYKLIYIHITYIYVLMYTYTYAYTYTIRMYRRVYIYIHIYLLVLPLNGGSSEAFTPRHARRSRRCGQIAQGRVAGSP